MSRSRRPLAALAGAAGAAAFARWDATDTKGGVGLTRAAAATSTAALIVADYKWSLFGMEKDSPPFVSARAALHERAAARLLRLCERNGGLYTKAGQFIGTASGMPAPFQRELSKLQDSATPLPFEDVRRVVNEALGDGAADASSAVSQSVVAYSASAPRDDVHETSTKHARVFASFDREPVAAASLAQVHRAVTADGDEVAVKVQRPGLRRQFDVDLATMRLITSAVTVAFPSFDFTFLVPEFAERLTRELDFELEGRMCERAGRALADDPRMVTPAALSPGPSSIFAPRTNSIVSTFPEVSDQNTSGVTMRGSSASARPARSHMRPSSSKSSSRVSRSANSGTRNVKSKLGNATVTADVMSRIVARSTSNCRRSPGRCTFTATSSPFAVTARCTCASDAAATGSRSNDANTRGGVPALSSGEAE